MGELGSMICSAVGSFGLRLLSANKTQGCTVLVKYPAA
jgi:hypothetical protein